MLHEWVYLGIFLTVALFIPAAALIIAGFLSPKKPNPIKNSTYECGMETIGDTWVQFKAQYYLFALIFVVFDVELAFMYPVMAVFKGWVADGRGLFALAEILLFIGVLAVGLVYVWAKGDLEWMKRVPAETTAGGDARRTV